MKAALLQMVSTTDVAVNLDTAERLLAQAAQAGAEYAVIKGWNSAAISGAVTGATGLTGLAANPAPVQSCGCPTGTAITAATCNSTCAAGGTAGTYVTVSAQSSYSTLIAYPGVTSPMTLSATSVVRIK